MRRILLGSALVALAFTHAQADTIRITDITGTWANAAGVSRQGNGTSHPMVSWQGSSYMFTAISGISLDTATMPRTPFTFGILSIVNRPSVSDADIITPLRLDVSAEVSLNGGPEQREDFWLNFDHYETANDTHFCLWGNAGQGCADSETVTDDSPGFQVGFTTDINPSGRSSGLSMSLVTQEDTSTFAFLSATIVDLTKPVPALALAAMPMPAPEPMSLTLLASGIAGLTLLRRRRRG